MLKFGQIVDLEKLEVLSSNPVIEEKWQKLWEMELQGAREMASVQGKIEQKEGAGEDGEGEHPETIQDARSGEHHEPHEGKVGRQATYYGECV